MQVVIKEAIEEILLMQKKKKIGLYFLNKVLLESKIDVLDISDCDISNKSMAEIIQWTAHLNELDLTGNPLLFDTPEEDREEFIANLNKSIYIKVDDFKVNKRNKSCNGNC